MYDEDIKLKMFFDKALWEKAIQHCIDKGIKPLELSPFTSAEFRGILYEIMRSGKYKVAPPHIALIPKDNGDFRKVYVNTVLDRLVLTIINEVYCSLYSDLIHPNCVSYQKHIGVKNIIHNITSEITSVDGVSGYKVDISKYFDNVSRETMNSALKTVSTGSCIDQILYDYYNDDLIMDENGNLIRKYKSLCQGCAPSAFFANIILRDVDMAMSEMCDVYYRYSDDLLILGSNADKAMEVLCTILRGKGLSVNPNKVEAITSDSWFTFLGCRIKGNTVSFSKKSLKNFVSQIEERVKCDGKHSEKDLKKVIRTVNNYLYTAYMKNSSDFGWAEYFFSIVNCENDIVELDKWLKDMLRGYVTGNGGRKKVGGLGCGCGDCSVMRGKGRCVKTNRSKTEGLLEVCGYISMHHLYKVYKINHDVYKAEVVRNMLI